ncbi:DUF1385 domain-containing protein [Pendulispora rubella]|uniref:DUF1385 domain-containing protein n=1 Tax=Pendulispora rubella TaxID=2741070 RepID=A0ABZ2LL73_9BACT
MTDARTDLQQTRQQPAPSATARPYIGGQAVLEGVMMRAPHSFSIVVRRRDGSLLVRERAVADERVGIRRWPLVRGVSSLVESLRLGSESLRFSVEQLEKDLAAEEAAELAKSKASTAGLSALLLLRAFGLSLFSLLSTDDGQAVASGTDAKKGARGAMGVMLVFAIAFLIALPQAAAAGINRLFNLGLEVQSPLFQVITGALKLTVVVGYMLLIRRVPDIRRVFQYHGAEHKTISTYEAGEELVVANARAKTTLHPRCGTTFLVMVALVSILVFTAVGGLLPRIHTGSAIADNVLFFLEKLPFLPLIAAATFEIQRVFARYCTTGPLRALLWPGFLVQKITTIEPDDDQLEVALASLRATLFREHGEVPEVADDVSFANYEALATASHLRS